MKRIFALAVILLLAFTASANEAHRAVISRVHSYTHTITQKTIVDGSKCSATAIAPHALLTASHCELPTNDLDVDGTTTKIITILRDGNDHSIFITNGTYKDFAVFSSDPAKIGDTVFIFGNPGKHNDIFRQGTVVAVTKEIPDSPFSDRVPPVTVCDLNSFSGDSGAAIFDETGETGEIVGVVSTVDVQKNPHDLAWTIKLTVSFGLEFSADQLKEVQR